MAVKETFQAAKDVVPLISPDDELHDLSELKIDDSATPGISTILSLAGAIKTTQGTRKVYFTLNNRDEAVATIERIELLVSTITKRLKASPARMLAKSDIVAEFVQFGLREGDYYDIVSLLSKNNVATSAGKGRTGGLQVYEGKAQSEEIRQAEKEIQEEGNEDERQRKESEREEALYPTAAKLISDLGFQAVILGKARRLPGEWNTPDVVGYKIHRLAVLGGAEIEVVTIEVKWSISKAAIAETNSHQRLSHRSFLMVYSELEDIDEVYLSELLDKGIGLICLKSGKPVVHSAARLNNSLRTDIDAFLSVALDTDGIQSIKDEIARYLYSDTLGRILPHS